MSSLESLVSSIESVKTNYFIVFSGQKNVSDYIRDKRSLFLGILLKNEGFQRTHKVSADGLG